jgi:kinesin family protein 6/9
MSRNSVKVCVRTRPTYHFAQDCIVLDEEQSIVEIHHPNENHGTLLNNKQNSFKFKFDHIFHNATQSAVYDMYARDTVQSVVDGINGAIMSYGQTGSGKTFTMVFTSIFFLIVYECLDG